MRTIPLALATFLLLAAPALAPAQQLRPGDAPLEVPDFPEEEEPVAIRPLPPIPETGARGRIAGDGSVVVERFEITGSTVFGDAELQSVAEPWTGREISYPELRELRNALTRLYVDRGYVTSGAVIPDQAVTEGVLRIEIVEGSLGDVRLEGLDWFREGYFERRLRRAAAAPLDVTSLEDLLQRMQEDRRIERLDAELVPGRRRGTSELSLAVQERRPLSLRVSASNERTPAVGSEGGELVLEHLNPTGNGDLLGVTLGLTEGFEDFEARYSIPLNARETEFEAYYRYSQSEIVEHPFEDLNIKSDIWTLSGTITHPLIRTRNRDLSIGLTGEYRKSDTQFVFGDFSFAPGADDGEVSIAVLRFFQSWTARSSRRVLAVRSSFNWGIDAFGATTSKGNVPDGQFVSWLGQFQLAQRMPESFEQRLPERFLGSQLILRADTQLAADELLSLEQFALGGRGTIRGYRENEAVRDMGMVSSIELRVPVWKTPLGRTLVELAPFFDYGRVWNYGSNGDDETLSSVGLGLRVRPTQRLYLELYWGGRLQHVKRRGNDIQNNGFHFRAEVAVF